jgi:hypothetical protein
MEDIKEIKAAPLTRQHPALRIVREEHERLAAVVHGMRYLMRAMREKAVQPDLRVFRAMLLYISEYPERLHHPKEDQYLFAPLRQRTHAHDATLAELESQHASGEALVRRLEHLLLRYEFGASSVASPNSRPLPSRSSCMPTFTSAICARKRKLSSRHCGNIFRAKTGNRRTARLPPMKIRWPGPT